MVDAGCLRSTGGLNNTLYMRHWLATYHHHTLDSAAMENELVRICQLVSELSEQLAHKQKMAGALHSQMHTLKV